jgi:D-alanyl-D-alanine dipeptidase
MKQLFQLLLVCTLFCCSSDKKQTQIEKTTIEQDSSSKSKIDDESNAYESIDYDVSQWKEITEKDEIILDLRYATENNFIKKQIYACGRCFLRPELAFRIKRLQKEIWERYRMKLKLFDCYRPRPAQQKLWDIVPDEKYVRDPAKGSMHNRGLAVDITLIDSIGIELDMGTAYDFFGRKAHTDYFDLPANVLKNRKVLSKMMEIHGLKGIQSEWWHYSLQTENAPLDDWGWPCK